MKYYTMKKGKYPQIGDVNEYEIAGNGWRIWEKGDRYWLSFIAAAAGGNEITIEIMKEDYILSKEGKIGLDELWVKYNNQ